NNKFSFTANGSLVKGFTDVTGHTGHSECPTINTNCLLFAVAGLSAGQDLIFSAGVTSGGQPVTLDQLQAAGMTITYQTSDGVNVTSAVGPNFLATSQQPTAPTTINTALFTPFYASNQKISKKQGPCGGSNGTTNCPEPKLHDGDPKTD